MRARTIRAWQAVHTWTSLVCTLFMLLLCLTGLPLVFHHELDHWLGNSVEAPAMVPAAARASLDRVMAAALARYPGKHGLFVSQEPDDDRIWYVTLSSAPGSEQGMKQVAVDARNAQALGEPPLEGGFVHLMLSLHTDLFIGLPGQLFMGAMGLLLLAALVSGVVLYAPFMRRLRFGEVRREKSARLRWLDLHNLLGIVTLAWCFVVGTTGVINTLADLLVDRWQQQELADMLAPYRGLPPVQRPGSLQAALDGALAREPGMKPRFVAFPGTSFASPHHYGVFLRGATPATQRLLKPVLVDARSAGVSDSRELPWYFTALLLSQPLHFGDYGGLAMQLLWALLDVITIVVLGSGLYLWWVRRRPAAVPDGSREGAGVRWPSPT